MKVLLFILLLTGTLSAVDIVKVADYDFVKPQNPDDHLLSLGNSCVTDYGTIIVSDSHNYNLNVYKDGRFMQKFGSKGIGPDEFLFVRKMVCRGNTLYVYDADARKIVSLKITDKGLIDTDSYKIFVRSQCFDFDVNPKGKILQIGEYYDRKDDGYCLKDPVSNEYMVGYKMFMGDFVKAGGASYRMSLSGNDVYLVWVHSLATLGRYDIKENCFTRLAVKSTFYKPIEPCGHDFNKIINMMIRGESKRKIEELEDLYCKGRYAIRTIGAFKDFVCVSVRKHCLRTDTHKYESLIIFDRSGKLLKEYHLPKCHRDSYYKVIYKQNENKIYALNIIEKEESIKVNCKVYKIE